VRRFLTRCGNYFTGSGAMSGPDARVLL
jgi:hypothetical protein